jgi:hypothetical protein
METDEKTHIEGQLQQSRAALGQKLEELGARVHAARDTVVAVERFPWAWLGSSVVLGYVLGRVTLRARQPA